jgi:hypothetical protein
MARRGWAIDLSGFWVSKITLKHHREIGVGVGTAIGTSPIADHRGAF